MNIEVKNLKLLFIYRLCFFKKVNFVTKNNNYSNIVNALNIKNNRKRIEYVYDEAIKHINKYYSNDLCKFENNQCIVQRNNKSDKINGCCMRCHLLTENGCSSINLPCKLIYCKTALGNVKLLKFSEIEILKCLSFERRMILRASFFNTRDEILNDMTYGFFYIIFRWFVKNIFKRKYST